MLVLRVQALQPSAVERGCGRSKIDSGTAATVDRMSGPVCANLSGCPQGKNHEKANATGSESSLNMFEPSVAQEGKGI